MCCSVWSINSLELRDERIDFAAFLSKPLADANWAIPTGRVIEILKSLLSLLLYHHVYANGLETVRVKWLFSNVQTCDVTRVHSATEWTASVRTLTHVQTCDVTSAQSATEWTASVHTSHMSKLVM